MGVSLSRTCREERKKAENLWGKLPEPTPDLLARLDGKKWRGYQVVRGDTVVRVASSFEVPTGNVVQEDGSFPDPYRLFPGMRLIILPREPGRPPNHRVVAGETLTRIAQEYDMPEWELQSANQDVNFDMLSHQQILRLHIPQMSERLAKRLSSERQLRDIRHEIDHIFCTLSDGVSFQDVKRSLDRLLQQAEQNAEKLREAVKEETT